MNKRKEHQEGRARIINPEIKLVIFDLWQTLVFTKYRPIDEIFEALDLKSNRDDFHMDISQSQLFTENIAVAQSLGAYLRKYTNNEAAIDKCVNLWMKASKDAFLGTSSMEVLDSLKKRGYKLCLLTNIDKYGYENFKFPQILGFFDYQFLSYAEGLAKPDQRCWEAIKEKFNIPFNEMLMIGDSLKNDLDPALKLGIRTFQIIDSLDINSLKENL